MVRRPMVGDDLPSLTEAFREATRRSSLVISTGGLGPTEDDITRECVAEVVGAPLEYHEEIFELIEAMFARYRIPLTENNKKQAMVPEPLNTHTCSPVTTTGGDVESLKQPLRRSGYFASMGFSHTILPVFASAQ